MEYDEENVEELERLIRELEEDEEETASIFTKTKSFFKKLTRKREKPPERMASLFDEFLKELDTEDEMYEIVEGVARLCDDAIVIAREKLVIIDRVHVLGEEIKEIKCYEKLTDLEIEDLKELLARFMSLTQDRNALRYQIIGFDKNLIKMEQLEEDAKFIVDNTQNAERQQRFLKHDLGYLQGEKSDLEYERVRLKNTQEFIYKFSIALVIVSGLLITFLVFIHIFRGINVFLPSAILCIVLILAINGMHSLKRYVKRQLIINMKKQHKAAEIYNKKIVVYAYYTNFLNFVYNKYGVRNSDKLQQNIKDYTNYKHLTTRFDAIRDMLYETEATIETFLREKGIVNTAITTERFAKSINIDDKRKYYAELKAEKDGLDARLKELDEQHNKIWSDLVILNEEDKSSTKIIDRIIQKYISEVNKLVNLKDEDREMTLDKDLEKSLEKMKRTNLDDILKTTKVNTAEEKLSKIIENEKVDETYEKVEADNKIVENNNGNNELDDDVISNDVNINSTESIVESVDNVSGLDNVYDIDNNNEFNYNDDVK